MKYILLLLLLLFALPLSPPGVWQPSRDIASIPSNDCFRAISDLIEDSSEKRIINQMETAKISKTPELNGSHETNVYLVSFYLSEHKAIFKPQFHVGDKFESFLSNSKAEKLAYLIDRKFGFNLVPPTTIRKDVEIKGELRWGSMQHYAGKLKSVMDIAISNGYGDEIWDMLGTLIKRVNQNDVNKLSFFDFLIENGDRHPGNCLVGFSGKLVAIDHGASFTGNGIHMKNFSQRREQIDAFLKTKGGKQILTQLQKFNQTEFYNLLINYISKDDAIRMIERIDDILLREQVKDQLNLSLESADDQLIQQIIKLADEENYQETLSLLADAIKIDKEMRTLFYMTLTEYESDLPFRQRAKRKKLKKLIYQLKNRYDKLP